MNVIDVMDVVDECDGWIYVMDVVNECDGYM